MEDGDGCSSECATEAGYTCSGDPACSQYICAWLVGNEVCGDGYTLGAELETVNFCDDGNTIDGDGCSSECRVECGYTCVGGTATDPDSCYTTCGDWIKTGKKAQDLPNDVNGNRVIETESGSVYRLVGPCLPGIKDWCKITNGPLRNQYVGSVYCRDGAEDYDEICTVYNSADPSHSTTTAATAQLPLLRRRTCLDAA